MFHKHTESGYTLAVPGIEMKTLVHGERTLMTEFLLKKGSRLPQHSHPHEQTGYLVNGRMRLAIGSEANDVMPGDSWCIPGGVEHYYGNLGTPYLINGIASIQEVRSSVSIR